MVVSTTLRNRLTGLRHGMAIVAGAYWDWVQGGSLLPENIGMPNSRLITMDSIKSCQSWDSLLKIIPGD
jgi:hypothetical protein